MRINTYNIRGWKRLFLKAGKTWDDGIEERASINDIDTNSLEQFIQDGLK